MQVQAGDGVRLRFALWPEGAKGRVLILPGRTEYCEKYGRVARDLLARGYGAVTLDWRGQGLSERLTPDTRAGHVKSFRDFQKDLQALLEALDELGEARPKVMIAHSMGGCIGLRALLRGLRVRAVAFSAPMWGIRMRPHALPAAWGLSTAARLMRISHRYVPGSGPDMWLRNQLFEGNLLTSDPDTYAWLVSHLEAEPDLGLGGPTLGWLNAALREVMALSLAPSPAVPVHVGLGTDEAVVSTRAIRRRMARWPNGTLVEYPGARHEIMMERPELRNAFLDAATALFDRTAG